MTADPTRIAQFRKMAADDPLNELGHFSLGQELLRGGEPAQAIESFDRVLEINPKFSKAYQLKADAQLETGDKAGAIESLTEGAKVAAARGDTLPKKAMVAKLEELGAAVPEEATKAGGPQVEVGEGEVFDVRTGQVGRRLARPPFKNRLGQLIYDNVSQESWQEWIGMGTKVINELRLPLSDPKAQQMFDQHMIEFLNLGDLVEEERNV